MRYKSFIILILIAFSFLNAKAQCLCGHITFQVILPEIDFRNGVSQYSIKSNYEVSGVGAQSYKGKYDLSDRPVFESECEGDTLYFLVRTGGGIDSLDIIIVNNQTGEKMQVIAQLMSYDTPYFIDLISFAPGKFLFNWNSIMECKRNAGTAEEVNCNGKNFLQLKHTNYSIRPIEIKDFGIL